MFMRVKGGVPQRMGNRQGLQVPEGDSRSTRGSLHSAGLVSSSESRSAVGVEMQATLKCMHVAVW